jgi:hypothetical protein
MKRSLYLLSIILVLSISPTARAQFAVEAGGSYDIQQGTFVAPCGCTFANGTGFGLMATAQFDLVSLLGVTIGIKSGLEQHNIHAKELTAAPYPDKEDVSITYLTIEPLVRVKIPTTDIFVQVAPGLNYMLSSSFHHTTGTPEPDEPELANPDTAMDLGALQFRAKATIGYKFSALGIGFEPAVSAAFPLSDLMDVTKNKTWHIATVYLSLGVRL